MTRKRIFLLLLLSSLFFHPGCTDNSPATNLVSTTDGHFDKEKWRVKEGEDYPFRAQMVNDVLYNDTIRTLNQAEIIELLGKPDRSENGHFYYNISRNRMGNMTLNSKTLVIKFLNEEKIGWIKLHG